MRPAVVLLLVLTAVLPAASAAPVHLPGHDRREVEQLAQRYLQHRADKVTAVAQTAGFGVPTTDRLAAELRTDEARLAARRERHGDLPHGGYSRADVRTSVRRLTVDPDGSVVAHVRELTSLYFVKSNAVPHTSFSMSHVLVFQRTRAGWTLAEATVPPGAQCGIPPETQFCGPASER
ncbi:hypothetical protein SAMN05216188_112113 [Lentzea xinjiangensis]|uniref:Mce-associated membrane protein n=1 Tax=Lentzea xinjiangensis TaxID=402600 RepID=A0A1H9PWP3_9PSEU|nr:hypothetical protein [Lentzea xinjiangensis]SER52548.1 hypothetical protein SAMN05216188_112113 [Lentzea xinjiangensis]